MKAAITAIALVILIFICALQQIWIVRSIASSSHATGLPAAPAITYQASLLADAVSPPQGAVGVGRNADSDRLTGIGYGDRGFDGCLWIDMSSVNVPATATPAIVAADHYAGQIAAAIPDAYVERAIERSGMHEALVLHATRVVHHRWGQVIIAAAPTASRDDLRQISSLVKVHILSINDQGSGRTQIHAPAGPVSR